MQFIKLWKPNNLIEKILCLISFLVIPFLSFLLASKESIFYDNLTYVGNQPATRMLFQLWGIVISLDYFFSFLYLLKITKEKRRSFYLLAIFLTTLSIISFFIPYNVEINPFLSNLHVYGSLFASVGTIALIMYFIYTRQNKNPVFFHRAIPILTLFISSLFLVLIILGDISGLAELILSSFLSIFLYYLVRLQVFTQTLDN